MTGPSSRRPRLPAIDARRCTGCGRCVAACAELHLLSLEAQHRQQLFVEDDDIAAFIVNDNRIGNVIENATQRSLGLAQWGDHRAGEGKQGDAEQQEGSAAENDHHAGQGPGVGENDGMRHGHSDRPGGRR